MRISQSSYANQMYTNQNPNTNPNVNRSSVNRNHNADSLAFGRSSKGNPHISISGIFSRIGEIFSRMSEKGELAATEKRLNAAKIEAESRTWYEKATAAEDFADSRRLKELEEAKGKVSKTPTFQFKKALEKGQAELKAKGIVVDESVATRYGQAGVPVLEFAQGLPKRERGDRLIFDSPMAPRDPKNPELRIVRVTNGSMVEERVDCADLQKGPEQAKQALSIALDNLYPKKSAEEILAGLMSKTPAKV